MDECIPGQAFPCADQSHILYFKLKCILLEFFHQRSHLYCFGTCPENQHYRFHLFIKDSNLTSLVIVVCRQGSIELLSFYMKYFLLSPLTLSADNSSNAMAYSGRHRGTNPLPFGGYAQMNPPSLLPSWQTAVRRIALSRIGEASSL